MCVSGIHMSENNAQMVSSLLVQCKVHMESQRPGPSMQTQDTSRRLKECQVTGWSIEPRGFTYMVENNAQIVSSLLVQCKVHMESQRPGPSMLVSAWIRIEHGNSMWILCTRPKDIGDHLGDISAHMETATSLFYTHSKTTVPILASTVIFSFFLNDGVDDNKVSEKKNEHYPSTRMSQHGSVYKSRGSWWSPLFHVSPIVRGNVCADVMLHTRICDFFLKYGVHVVTRPIRPVCRDDRGCRDMASRSGVVWVIDCASESVQ